MLDESSSLFIIIWSLANGIDFRTVPSYRCIGSNFMVTEHRNFNTESFLKELVQFIVGFILMEVYFFKVAFHWR